MRLFDVNVLIYAHRSDQPDHEFYRDYVERHVSGSHAFAMSPLVAGGFVRIVTHPRFPNGPTPLAQALAVIDSMASLEHCHWTGPRQRHWALVANLCRQCGLAGKRVADSQHAAIAIEHACRWVTRDRDFEVFTTHGLQLELLVP
jgi:toxin-antitoxin system PIN domain toxin